MQPFAFRPLRQEYLTIAKILQDDSYLDMSEENFVKVVLRESNGALSPKRIRMIYQELMKDAGIIQSPAPVVTNENDNGDYSWEYYVSPSKTVKAEEYSTAHSSYFKS